MANANKNKGKAYERVVAKHLSQITNLSFLRVPNSGAFVGGMNFHRAETLSQEQVGMFEGDIITPVEWNHVRLECKWYKEITWSSLFSSDGEPKLNSWIEQAEQGTRPYWFICFKINHIGEFVIFPNIYCTSPVVYGGVPNLAQPMILENISYFIYKGKYRIVTMEKFFELNFEAIQKYRIALLNIQKESQNEGNGNQ
jgi:hypothetical protein